MILNNSEWFLLGAFSILFLYYITHYLTRRSEKYNLYFAIGCLVSSIRTITINIHGLDDFSSYYTFLVWVLYLSFLWGPVFYILLADSLFPNIGNKNIVRVMIFICAVLSILKLVISVNIFQRGYIYDFVIITCILYASYIYTIALIKREQFALLLFIANLIFIIGVIYDVLCGSYVISSPFGELNPYTYFVYLYITSVVLAKKHNIIDKKRLETQVKFLHAQIQPHFLYNTLNTIIAYCRTDPDQSRELLIELSKYLRGKFKNEKDMFTPLNDEIELIKSYLNIEQVRFKERLCVDYDIDEECNIFIPCLIIQPIVENSVKHGLTPKKEGGKLSISVKKENNSIVVKIKDNGIGMDTDKLSDILEGSETGIGLSNTNERLKRYYNTEITAKSEVGIGTEFTVTIPLKKRKK